MPIMKPHDKNKIIIRPARTQDIRDRGQKGIRDLFNAVRRDERRQHRSPLAPPQYGNWSHAMEKQAKGEERFQVLVAEFNGEIVGFCKATHLKDEPSTTLEKLFTAPETQGVGLGRMFIDRVIKQAAALDKNAIHTCAEAGKGKASGFYQHLGFKVINTKSTTGGIKKDYLRLPV
jgi:GNAT superfamily N-acetyltransferase